MYGTRKKGRPGAGGRGVGGTTRFVARGTEGVALKPESEFESGLHNVAIASNKE